MVRYYYGDIEGEFVCDVQSSDTMDKFGAVSVANIWYKCCGCEYVENDDYCKECYISKEEHINQMIEEEEDTNECFAEDNTLNSEITKEDFVENVLPFIREHRELYYKGQVDEDDLVHDEEEIYYDLVMLMKILTFFENNEAVVCRWNAEL